MQKKKKKNRLTDGIGKLSRQSEFKGPRCWREDKPTEMSMVFLLFSVETPPICKSTEMLLLSTAWLLNCREVE